MVDPFTVGPSHRSPFLRCECPFAGHRDSFRRWPRPPRHGWPAGPGPSEVIKGDRRTRPSTRYPEPNGRLWLVYTMRDRQQRRIRRGPARRSEQDHLPNRFGGSGKRLAPLPRTCFPSARTGGALVESHDSGGPDCPLAPNGDRRKRLLRSKQAERRGSARNDTPVGGIGRRGSRARPVPKDRNRSRRSRPRTPGSWDRHAREVAVGDAGPRGADRAASGDSRKGLAGNPG